MPRDYPQTDGYAKEEIDKLHKRIDYLKTKIEQMANYKPTETHTEVIRETNDYEERIEKLEHKYKDFKKDIDKNEDHIKDNKKDIKKLEELLKAPKEKVVKQ